MARVRILTPEQAVDLFGDIGGVGPDAVATPEGTGGATLVYPGDPVPTTGRTIELLPTTTLLHVDEAPLNPLQFGASANFDPATEVGTDDTAAVQAMLNEAATTGRPVDFLDRHYRINNTLTVTDCPGFTVTGGRSAVSGAMSNANGAWLHYTGTSGAAMVRVHNSVGVTWQRVGLNARNIADGIVVTSDNAPVTKDITIAEMSIHRPLAGVILNDSGLSTQTDQLEVRAVRVTEAVEAGFRTDSDNTTNVLFQRCSSTLAGSLTDQVHFDFRRGTLLKVDNCSGGHGQDFIRLGVPVNAVVVDTSQFEGSTHVDRAFLRTAITATGNTTPITLRNCVPDNPVIIGQQSRRLLTQGCTWQAGSGGSVVLSGDNTYWLSEQDTIDASLAVVASGVNSRVQRLGRFTYGPPTTGTYIEGEYLPEHSPVTNNATGYTCTASGSPGTWHTHVLTP